LHNIHISFSPARSRIFIIVVVSHKKMFITSMCGHFNAIMAMVGPPT
jgi:hypothetical protein